MNSFNRKIAEKFGPQRAKPKKFGCLGNFLHGALRPCIFIARHPEAEPQRLFHINGIFRSAQSDGEKRFTRHASPNPIDSVSLIKIIHPITFWQRFFFLWLRFFLFGRSKKKEMNKTALYTTGYFAYAQYDTPSFFGSASESLTLNNKQPPSA